MSAKVVSIGREGNQYYAHIYAELGPHKCPDTFSVAITPAKARELLRKGIQFDR
jgi:hypothetical protein